MASIYYTNAAKAGLPPKTGLADVTVNFQFTWPAVAVAADACVLAWIPIGAVIQDWEFDIRTAFAATTFPIIIGDLSTAGTIVGANNYAAAILGQTIQKVYSGSSSLASTGIAGTTYNSISTNAAAGFLLLTNVPSGAADAMVMSAPSLTGTAAAGAIAGFLRYTLQNP